MALPPALDPWLLAGDLPWGVCIVRCLLGNRRRLVLDQRCWHPSGCRQELLPTPILFKVSMQAPVLYNSTRSVSCASAAPLSSDRSMYHDFDSCVEHSKIMLSRPVTFHHPGRAHACKKGGCIPPVPMCTVRCCRILDATCRWNTRHHGHLLYFFLAIRWLQVYPECITSMQK